MRITQKVRDYSVAKPEDTLKILPPEETSDSVPSVPMAEVIQMHEKIERPTP